MKRYMLIMAVEDHSVETFERETGCGVGEDGNLEIYGYAYYDKLESVTPLPGFPPCPDHKEVQHRDRKPPWCDKCGWAHGRPAVPARPLGSPRE